MAISLKVFLRIGGIVGAILLATFNLWNDIESIAPLLSSIETFHSSFNEMGSKMASTNDTITIMSNHETDIPHLTMYGALRSAKSFLLLPGWLQEYFEWHIGWREVSTVGRICHTCLRGILSDIT